VVSIVGTDEVDLNRKHISWVSPLGRALLKSAPGDSIVLQAPGGIEYLAVLRPRQRRPSPMPIHLTKVSERRVKFRRASPSREGTPIVLEAMSTPSYSLTEKERQARYNDCKAS
jgi:transcription elongation factor GreB